MTTRTPPLLLDLFEQARAKHATRLAIDIPPGDARPERTTATYDELWTRSSEIAGALRGEVEHEDIVALLLARTDIDLFAAELAALRLRGAWLALDPALPDAHLRRVLADAKPACLLTNADHVARAEMLIGDASPVHDTRTLTSSTTTIDAASVAPSDLAYVIYTSGSTGEPKGVLLEHRGIARLIEGDLAAFDLGPGDRIAQGSSHAFDSSVEEVWLAFSAGATVVVLDDETVRAGPDLPAWLRRERITVFCPPPTLLRAMGVEDPKRDLPAIRLLYVGGEPLPQDLADAWAADRHMVNGYGPTECSVTCTRAEVVPGEAVSIGDAVPGSRAYVLDSELRPCPDGTPGELCISGDGLARGYLGASALTAERFPTHPEFGRIYRTGDRAVRAPDGSLRHLGRMDAQAKVRGHRIELEAVELALASIDGIRGAGCRVIDPEQGGTLVAWLVPEAAGTEVDTESIAARLAEAFPPPMQPSRYHVVAELPVQTSGKLDRSALVEATGAGAATADPDPAAAPLDPLESAIANAAAEVLGRQAIGRDQDFFGDLRGDSVTAARLISRLRQSADTTWLTVRDVYERRTVAGLGERARETAAAAPRPETVRGERPRRTRAFTLAQALVLFGELLVGSGIAYTLFFLILEPLLTNLGLVATVLLVPVATFAIGLLWVPCGIALLAVMKRLLVGRYEAGRIPAFSRAHFRHWWLMRFAGLVPWGLLRETVFLHGVLRRLGARIGDDVHIHAGVDLRAGGWDLLEIGDDATIGQDACAAHTSTLDRRAPRPGAASPSNAGADDPDARVAWTAGSTRWRRRRVPAGALSWLPAGRHACRERRALVRRPGDAEPATAPEAPSLPERPARRDARAKSCTAC